MNEFFCRVARRDCENRGRDLVGNLDLLGDRRCVVTGHGCKGTTSEPCEMRSEYLVGIGRIERPAVHQFGTDVTELVVESRSDELLIEPARKPLHAKNLRSWVGQPPDEPSGGSDGVTGLWEASRRRNGLGGRLETSMSNDVARVEEATQARVALAVVLRSGAPSAVAEVVVSIGDRSAVLPSTAVAVLADALELIADGFDAAVRRFAQTDASRRRCAGCGEPVELAYADDPESWVHAFDANDQGDHTAWIDG